MRKEKPTCEPCNPAGSEVSSNRIGGTSEEEEKKQKQKQCKEPQKLKQFLKLTTFVSNPI